MKISCNVLKKHIANSSDIDFLHIWDLFTIRTAEVENVTVKGADIKDVVVGEIIECNPHPKKEKYHILKVDNGTEIVDILCGAPNVRTGLKAPIVKVGGMVSGFTIEPKEIAGVLSKGMLCSGKELGISDAHEGILELPNDWIVGKDIKDYISIDDIIVEIDNKSLTNRPDLWGHYGIAREIAAITKHKLLDLPLLDLPKEGKKLNIEIKEPKLCLRYTGIQIDNIESNESPFELQTTLYYTGSRSISLLVDLTNYVMLELGQPMHAFDATKVDSIEIGLAREDATFTTLDGVERKLTREDLMIKKNDDYFAIAGVMGGMDSEVEDDTKSIILESATFDAFQIRTTAIRLGLRTDASAHYEKSLDPNMTEIASKRFAYLLKEINKNITLGRLTDVYPQPLKEPKIKLTRTCIDKNINKDITDEEVINILTSLSFKVKKLKDAFEVTVPTYRATKDISLEADLIEEIARMYGYENIKKEPLKIAMSFNETNNTFDFYYNIKRLLATKYNMNEVHSYLWYKTSFLNKLGIEKDNVKLLGKKEDNVLRDDLSLTLLEIAEGNLKYEDKVSIFEIGTIIRNDKNYPVLSIVVADSTDNIEYVYQKVKEILVNVTKTFKNKELLFDKVAINGIYDANLSKEILIDGKKIGLLKVVNNSYASKITKKKCFVCGEIFFSEFNDIEKERVLYQDISKYQEVKLDYSIICNSDYKYIQLKNILDGFKSQIIKNYELVDRYQNDAEIRYTIRYSLVSPDRTLNEEDLTNFKELFIKYLEENDLKIVM